MNKVTSRAGALLVLVFVLCFGTFFFLGEYLFDSHNWISPGVSDSGTTAPSLQKQEVVLKDREGIFLMQTGDGTLFAGNSLLRQSMIHWIGDGTGNISAPILSHYQQALTFFDPVNGSYVYGNEDPRVTLTLSARIQVAALEAMGEHKGTVAVYNYRTGELLCAVSTPGYDPENIPDIAADPQRYEGAYMNRFVSATYPPGSIFKIVTTIAALETIPDVMEQTLHCDGEILYPDSDKPLTCMSEHGDLTLKEAFMRSCNCAFAQLADQLGGETLESYAKLLGLTDSISFDGFQTKAGSVTIHGQGALATAWSACGQHLDMVNPCQYMTLMGLLASGGTGKLPYVTASVSCGDVTAYTASGTEVTLGISAETLHLLREFMRNNVENYYGDEHFDGLKVCAKSGTAEVGGGREDNAMFAGFVEDESYPLAFIVVVENGGFGRQTCIPILSQILRTCVEVLDGEN